MFFLFIYQLQRSVSTSVRNSSTVNAMIVRVIEIKTRISMLDTSWKLIYDTIPFVFYDASEFQDRVVSL